ncbi:MAG: FdrA family protein [Spirochaetes bacterium]|nr:MAG: FdrA family protein [Spirochaetota bacterium]
MQKILVEKDSYYDSVFLMLINKEVKQFKGVKDAVVSMGTEVNVELLKGMGLFNSEIESSTPNDLIIAVEAEKEDVAESAIKAAKELLNKKKSQAQEGDEYRPVTLDKAVEMVPDANLVVVSVPGNYAAREVKKALNKNLHVMLFSDNVSLEEEIELKELAEEKGLLMMGPDCGTAIINGKPLCFANVISKGNIGIVAASGTGLQEVSCSIDKFGGGISQGIGTGGRDLKNSRVGGRMMRMGIAALKNDPETKVITVISKPPAEDVAEKVIADLKKTGKPCVIHFIGLTPGEESGNIQYARNLEEAAGVAVALSKGETYKPRMFTIPEDEIEKLVSQETKNMNSKQKYLRGLYTGGTLADEAMIIFEKEIGNIYSNNQTNPDLVLDDPHVSKGNTIVDLGDDVFTVGRPHPMIDPSTREERIVKETEDPEMAVMLLDVVLGYGSHEDPAGAILKSLADAKKKAEERGGYLSIIASVTGTNGDFQGMDAQKKKLESIGCIVMPSNYQASMLALKIIREVA